MAEPQPVAGVLNPLSTLPFLNAVVAMETLFYFEKTLPCPRVLTKAKLLFGCGWWEQPRDWQRGAVLVEVCKCRGISSVRLRLWSCHLAHQSGGWDGGIFSLPAGCHCTVAEPQSTALLPSPRGVLHPFCLSFAISVDRRGRCDESTFDSAPFVPCSVWLLSLTGAMGDEL